MNKRTLTLLDALGHDARASSRALARKLRVSQQAANSRMHALEESGVIRKYTTIFDGARLGLSSYTLLLRFRSYEKGEMKQFIDDLCHHPDVVRVEELDYRWDVLAVLSAQTNSWFNRSIESILEAHEGLVEEIRIMPGIVTYFFNYTLVPKKRGPGWLVLYGDKRPISLDPVDRAVCKHLLGSSRASVVSMAKACDRSPQTVISRMRRLEAQGVIQRYGVLLNLDRIGFKKYFLLLGFKALHYNEPDLTSFLSAHPLVSRVHKVIGPWQMVIEIISPDTQSCMDLVREVQKRNAPFIESLELVSSRATHKHDYIPENALQEQTA